MGDGLMLKRKLWTGQAVGAVGLTVLALLLGCGPGSEKKVSAGAPSVSVPAELRQEEPLTAGSEGQAPADSGQSGTERVIPVHPWRKTLVENIRKESIRETIENLTNIDDAHFAHTAGPWGYSPGELRSEVSAIAHLRRVRRLFELGSRDPQEMVPLLRDVYWQALADWPAEWEQWLKAWDEARARGPGEHPEWSFPPLEKVRSKAVVATYLLAELQDHESLPLLLEGYRLQAEWLRRFERHFVAQAPVPPALTLYAMHRLVSSFPRESLDPEAVMARQTYMEWAAEHVPPPRILEATTWFADYHESDPFRRIADPEGVVLRDQPTMALARYPYRFVGREYMQEMEHLTERGREWAELLLPCVQSIVAQRGPR